MCYFYWCIGFPPAGGFLFPCRKRNQKGTKGGNGTRKRDAFSFRLPLWNPPLRERTPARIPERPARKIMIDFGLLSGRYALILYIFDELYTLRTAPDAMYLCFCGANQTSTYHLPFPDASVHRSNIALLTYEMHPFINIVNVKIRPY